MRNRWFPGWKAGALQRNYSSMLLDVEFEWDGAKARANYRKHGVAFAEARTAFHDPSARLLEDPDHSADEERYVLLGISVRLRLLVVSHSYRGTDDRIRIISARRAAPGEAEQYNRWQT